MGNHLPEIDVELSSFARRMHAETGRRASEIYVFVRGMILEADIPREHALLITEQLCRMEGESETSLYELLSEHLDEIDV